MKKLEIPSLEELALDAFRKQEYLNALSMMNTPTDYKEREKAFVEYAKAQKAASEARSKLTIAVNS